MKDLAVGQTVYLKFQKKYLTTDLVPALVVKIGRKWIELRAQRGGTFRMQIGYSYLDGGESMSPGQVYRTPEEYEKKVLREETWDKVFYFMRNRFHPPDNMPTETIQKLAELVEAYR